MKLRTYIFMHQRLEIAFGIHLFRVERITMTVRLRVLGKIYSAFSKLLKSIILILGTKIVAQNYFYSILN